MPFASIQNASFPRIFLKPIKRYAKIYSIQPILGAIGC